MAMWTRKELKTRAKSALKGSYWKAFIVSLVLSIVNGFSSDHGSGDGIIKYRYENSEMGHYLSNMKEEFFEFFFTSAFAIVIIGAILWIIFRVVLGYLLEIGGRKYFVKAAEDRVNMNHLVYFFRKDYYMNIVGTMFYRDVLLFFWTLLLIIPGIIKSYSYRMVPYILADNPQIGHERAITLSRDMTEGEKFNIFVLDLSFIGWYILGVLALFIGGLFVAPYENATNAELYLELRQRALDRGLCRYEELNVRG